MLEVGGSNNPKVRELSHIMLKTKVFLLAAPKERNQQAGAFIVKKKKVKR